MTTADIRFYFDPVCPFCWLTSKWIRMVQAERDLSVEWRFISLRLINSHIDYDAHFPPEYEAGHTAGLRLLRVAARAREEHGAAAVDVLQAALGAHIFDSPPTDATRRRTANGVARRSSSRRSWRRPTCPPSSPTRSTTRRGTTRSAPTARRRSH